MSGYVRDPLNANSPQRAAEFEVYKNVGSTDISRGDVVVASGDGIAVGAADGLAIGVAAEDIASGEAGMVQTYGYCDYVTTDEGVTSSDVVLIPGDGGVATGQTAAEIGSTPANLIYAFAYSLGEDHGSVGTCFIFK